MGEPANYPIVIVTTDGLAGSLAGEDIRNRVRDQIQYSKRISDFEWSVFNQFSAYNAFRQGTEEMRGVWIDEMPLEDKEESDGDLPEV
jgi:hypothetical protein